MVGGALVGCWFRTGLVWYGIGVACRSGIFDDER